MKAYSVKQISENTHKIVVQVNFKSEEGEWYSVIIGVPKSAIKYLGRAKQIDLT